MAEVGIRALKQNASAVVKRAAAGEVVTITDRGRPVAQLGPLAASRLEALTSAGLLSRARRRPSDLPPPAPAKEGERALSEVLEELRRSERY